MNDLQDNPLLCLSIAYNLKSVFGGAHARRHKNPFVQSKSASYNTRHSGFVKWNCEKYSHFFAIPSQTQHVAQFTHTHSP
jgi:hypothetical protein